MGCDYVGEAHAMQGAFTTFSNNRKQENSSSLEFNGGYAIVPEGIYFNTPQFSFTMWIKPESIITHWSRILDFGNGRHTNSNILLFYSGDSTRIHFEIYDGRHR